MALIKLSGKEIRALFQATPPDLPKYASQLLNLANQIAQATRPKVVGRMHEMFEQANPQTLDEWRSWYLKHHGKRLEEAVDRIELQLQKFRKTLDELGKEEIREWLADLVIVKTWMGLRVQRIILKYLATRRQLPLRKATAEEEAKGIDGFIGEVPVSIKPVSYKAKSALLQEDIGVTIIYYEKTPGGIQIEIPDDWL